MNKKSLRQFAGPGWAIPPGHGLLHAEQVRYIVRTAVRIIDRRRILVLYIYDREQVLRGVSVPRWTMFQQGHEEYITLEHGSDGRSKWRRACFDGLNRDYFFVRKCAFYSQQDEARVSKYFRSTRPGFSALYRVQADIQAARLAKRLRQRDRAVLERMKALRALPRNLESWVRRSVMPAYFFYDYSKRKQVTGVCSACGGAITLTGARNGSKTVCPHCGCELTMKSRGRYKHIYDRDTCQVVQRVSENELVIRIIKVHYSYSGDMHKENIYENARIFLRLNESGKVCLDSYYYKHGSCELTPWRQGVRPAFYPYQYYFEADVCGYVYTGNLPQALAGTPWQYCPLKLFYEHFHERMELVPFFEAHIEHPRFEHLVKIGFYRLATDLAYRACNLSTLDETQNRTHRILQVAPEDVSFLKEIDIGLSTLRAFQEHSRLKGRHELFRWTQKHKVVQDIDKILPYMTVHRLLRYMDSQYAFLQFRKTPNGTMRYKEMQDLVREYRDYLDMCIQEHYDMKNDFVLYPKDLQKAHDIVSGRIKRRVDAKARRKFKAVYQRIGNSMDFEFNGMKIICPAVAGDIITEGQALHHCVGSYTKRVADGECLILFLRRCENIDKPFYTIELREREVMQIKGANNTDATPEVQKFVECWTREVLQKKMAA